MTMKPPTRVRPGGGHVALTTGHCRRCLRLNLLSAPVHWRSHLWLSDAPGAVPAPAPDRCPG